MEHSRRDFVKGTGLAVAAVALGGAAAEAWAEEGDGKPRRSVMKIGFHTDAFNTSYSSFEECMKWAQKNDVHCIECGLIDGVSWIHGLGYQPHVAMYEDPVLMRKKLEGYGLPGAMGGKPGDPLAHLAESIKTWKEYVAKFAAEPQAK